MALINLVKRRPFKNRKSERQLYYESLAVSPTSCFWPCDKYYFSPSRASATSPLLGFQLKSNYSYRRLQKHETPIRPWGTDSSSSSSSASSSDHLSPPSPSTELRFNRLRIGPSPRLSMDDNDDDGLSNQLNNIRIDRQQTIRTAYKYSSIASLSPIKERDEKEIIPTGGLPSANTSTPICQPNKENTPSTDESTGPGMFSQSSSTSTSQSLTGTQRRPRPLPKKRIRVRKHKLWSISDEEEYEPLFDRVTTEPSPPKHCRVAEPVLERIEEQVSPMHELPSSDDSWTSHKCNRHSNERQSRASQFLRESQVLSDQARNPDDD